MLLAATAVSASPQSPPVHRGIADVMRYAAINQTLDVLAASDGFIPAARDGKTLAPPGQGQFNGAADRHSAQLYALGRYI